MFPEHGGVFMNLELKKQLYRISASLQNILKTPLPLPLPSLSTKTKSFATSTSTPSLMSEDEEEDQLICGSPLCLTINYGTVSEEAAANRIAIQNARNQDRRIQGIFFPMILPVAAQKNVNLAELNWMKHQSTSPPAWSSQHHSAYTFAKIFALDFANKHRHSYSKSSHSFPAYDLDFKRTIKIRTHLELRKLNGKNEDQIVKISETRSKFHCQDRTSTCIYIH
jgi:hypothetical protein